MSQVKADDYVNSAGTGAPKFSKGIDLSQAAGYNKYATVAKSADYTVTTTDGVETILVTAASNVTITLPAASGSTGRRLTIKKVDSGSGYVAIVRAGSDTIDGATTRYIPKQYDYLEIESDGTTWHITRDYRHIHVRLVSTGNQSLTVATNVTVTAFSITSDSLSMYTSTANIVIKESGWYLISYQYVISISFSSPPTHIHKEHLININNSTTVNNILISGPLGTSSAYLSSGNTFKRYMSLNDTIQQLAYINYTGGSGISLNGGIGSAVSMIQAIKI